jgi:Zn-finger nucleic acid-binding protein
MICYEMTNPEAAHNMTFVPAKDATCTENGNIAYYTCDACGGCWDNENAMGMPLNRMMVIVPAAHTYDNDCDPDCNVCFENREDLAHNIIHVEANAATCTTEGNIEYWYCDVCGMAWLDEACTLNTNLLSVKLPASCSYSAVYTAAKAATCYEPGNVEYWYCANCDVYYADAACAIVTNAKNVIIPITHNVIHVEAKAPTCTENGNIEYWYCDACGSAWLDEACTLNTNLKAVVLGATCATNAVHNEGIEAACHYTGVVENWYCANCDVYYLDAACTVITNYLSTIIPAKGGDVTHIDAVAPGCHYIGNIEYWYCPECEQFWQDEALTQLTNSKNVILPALESTATYVTAVDSSC